MNKQQKILRKAAEISEFCMELARKFPSRYCKADTQPYEDFTYAQALIEWEESGRDPRAIFSSVKMDDPFFMEFKSELTARFKLPVMSISEAKKHKRNSEVKYLTKNVTGFLN